MGVRSSDCGAAGGRFRLGREPRLLRRAAPAPERRAAASQRLASGPDRASLFLAEGEPPKRELKRDRRPPRSSNCCEPPVQAGWVLGSMSRLSVAPSAIGRAGLELGPVGHDDLDHVVLGMNIGLHRQGPCEISRVCSEKVRAFFLKTGSSSSALGDFLSEGKSGSAPPTRHGGKRDPTLLNVGMQPYNAAFEWRQANLRNALEGDAATPRADSLAACRRSGLIWNRRAGRARRRQRREPGWGCSRPPARRCRGRAPRPYSPPLHARSARCKSRLARPSFRAAPRD